MTAFELLAQAAKRDVGPTERPFTIKAEQVTKLCAFVYAGRIVLLIRAFLERKPFLDG